MRRPVAAEVEELPGRQRQVVEILDHRAGLGGREGPVLQEGHPRDVPRRDPAADIHYGPLTLADHHEVEGAAPENLLREGRGMHAPGHQDCGGQLDAGYLGKAPGIPPQGGGECDPDEVGPPFTQPRPVHSEGVLLDHQIGHRGLVTSVQEGGRKAGESYERSGGHPHLHMALLVDAQGGRRVH